MEDILSDNELNALKLFNKVCVSLRGDYDKTANGLITIWNSALNIFSNTFNKSTLKALLSALLKRTPHWETFINNRAVSTIEKLSLYFNKCALSLDHASSGEYYQSSSFRSYIGEEASVAGFCLVHPNRKIPENKLLCRFCISKAKHLHLDNYPLDYGLLYVLKMRKAYGNSVEYCVNHSNRLALGNGLCVYCNRELGKLDQEIDKMGFAFDKFKNVFIS